MRKISLFVFLSLMMCSLVIGQDFHENEKFRDRVKQIKIWKLTEKLSLTEEQSLRFFPLYSSNQDDLEKLRRNRMKLMRGLKEKLSEMDEKQIQGTLKEIMSIEKEQIEKIEQFMRLLDPILSNKQKAELVLFEGDFIRMVGRAMEKQRGKDRRLLEKEDFE